MTSAERFQKVKEIFYNALEMDIAARASYIAQACNNDQTMINEINDLLRQDSDDIILEAIQKEVSNQAAKALSIKERPLIGRIIKERYKIIREFAQGGFGIIYLAFDISDNDREVLVKVLKPQMASDIQEWVEKHFLKEAQALQRISHPNIVTLLDFGTTEEGTQFLVMEKIDGCSLRSQIVATKGLMGGFKQAAEIIKQMGEAISAAHDCGVYHRDLKPDNVILQVDNSASAKVHIKIIDFNVATVKDSYDERTKSTQFPAGSFNYIAPEQVENKPSRYSDIYGFGVIAYEMLTGYTPLSYQRDSEKQIQVSEFLEFMSNYKLKNPQEINANIPTKAAYIVLKALAIDPKKRYARAETFGIDLSAALITPEKTPVKKEPEPTVLTYRPYSRFRLITLLVALILVTNLMLLLGWKYLVPNNSSIALPTSTLANNSVMPLEIHYSLELQEQLKDGQYGASVSLAGQEVIFHDGDLIKFKITSSSSGYLYALNESPKLTDNLPRYTLLFPTLDEQHAITKSQSQVIPSTQDLGFQFIGSKGIEKVWLIFSKEPLSEIESLRYLINNNDQGVINSSEKTAQIQKLINNQNPIKPTASDDNSFMIARCTCNPAFIILKLIHH